MSMQSVPPAYVKDGDSGILMTLFALQLIAGPKFAGEVGTVTCPENASVGLGAVLLLKMLEQSIGSWGAIDRWTVKSTDPPPKISLAALRRSSIAWMFWPIIEVK